MAHDIIDFSGYKMVQHVELGDFHGVSITRFDWQRVTPEELDGVDGTSLVRRSGKTF